MPTQPEASAASRRLTRRPAGRRPAPARLHPRPTASWSSAPAAPGSRIERHVPVRPARPARPPGARRSIAAHAVSVLASQQFTTAVVIGYGPGPLVTPLADAIREAITGTGLELRDVLRVEGRPLLVLSVHQTRPAAHPKACPSTSTGTRPRSP